MHADEKVVKWSSLREFLDHLSRSNISYKIKHVCDIADVTERPEAIYPEVFHALARLEIYKYTLPLGKPWKQPFTINYFKATSRTIACPHVERRQIIDIVVFLNHFLGDELVKSLIYLLIEVNKEDLEPELVSVPPVIFFPVDAI